MLQCLIILSLCAAWGWPSRFEHQRGAGLAYFGASSEHFMSHVSYMTLQQAIVRLWEREREVPHIQPERLHLEPNLQPGGNDKWLATGLVFPLNSMRLRSCRRL